MKLKIMTLDRRAFSVNFSESKTVWDLKVHIHRNRGSWLHPHNQRLLYAGQVLDDKRLLRSYCIDERKFLLMLAKKANVSQIRKTSISTTDFHNSKPVINEKSEVIKKSSLYKIKKSSSTSTSIKCSNPSKNTTEMYPMFIRTEDVKKHIMKLGPWKEAEVRRALLISLNNPNRAIQYLLTEKTPFPKMVSPPSSRLFLSKSRKNLCEKNIGPQSPKIESDLESTDYEQATSTAQVNNCNEKSVRWNFIENKLRKSTHDIQRLVDIGFPRDIVVEAYHACDGNAELAAELLYEQYVEDNC